MALIRVRNQWALLFLWNSSSSSRCCLISRSSHPAVKMLPRHLTVLSRWRTSDGFGYFSETLELYQLFIIIGGQKRKNPALSTLKNGKNWRILGTKLSLSAHWGSFFYYLILLFIFFHIWRFIFISSNEGSKENSFLDDFRAHGSQNHH